jgi:ABC-type amino acid transport substrate-binding protein
MQGKYVTKVFKTLFICCLVALFIILPGNFSPWIKQQYTSKTTPVQPVELSAKERNWIKAHQPIRVAFDGHFPPYSFINETGQLAGISYDTLQLISQKLDIKIKIDGRTLWKDIYQAALNKKVDVIATMVNRHDREFQFSFTQPYIFKSLVIVTHITNQQIKNRSHLAGKTVALVKGYIYSKHILKDHPEITPFYVDTMEDALFAVETKQADAAISFYSTSYFFQNKNLLSNIKFAAYLDHNSANESMAVRSDWPILTTILQKGLDSLTEAEKRSIR